MSDKVIKRLEASVEDNSETGVFRCRRDIFTDLKLFELEMKHIWEGNWIYLAHESQIPNNNDYITGYIGRQPIVISRDRKGELHAFLNACSHRGAMICRHKRGNKSSYTCPFHGWTFNNTGKLLKAKDPEGAGYPENFNKNGSHDLTKVARFENYRGFLFGSLNADVMPLEAHLGEARKTISTTSEKAGREA
jgi:benzoate/toluate 1,2-dioxygenase alpha subunit